MPSEQDGARTHRPDGGEPIHPLERLRKAGEKARKRREQERVHCPECDTTVWKDSLEEAVETAESHDEKRHDGERTTKINGVLLPRDDIVEAAQDAVDGIGGRSA